jgi:hypothetical protein
LSANCKIVYQFLQLWRKNILFYQFLVKFKTPMNPKLKCLPIL